ncbi:hypothetical protein OH738_20760 [Streptomyces hirsutus]|uniref:Integral membrane protein n=1 Tax=Streptomyces hirsutus TaxID=35620 RepID=A0ABZ1GQN5_9ACTN|nr:hypothetical protein [Streptomyces hirsutus]WSD07596.1 hypothetical protein OIE73_18830 [Streptomyces hirsutus]WTD18974.1 hypothetical protein OH738_20760 [Streptomyces hirsutus]WTD76095.1 hypothetical protein OHB56_20725 [Streptomyces sp. NBC_01635]
MAHAAPRPQIMPGQRPEGIRVFGERAHAVAKLAGPIALGLVYGYWAAANQRYGGPLTGWNILFGFLTALVFAALCIALLNVASKLRREVHAVLWGAFSGAAIGFLVNQSHTSVLRSAALGVAVAAGVSAFLFYRYYTHEDAQGHHTE